MAATARTALPTSSDRIGILFLEHAKVYTRGSQVVAATAEATLMLPTAALTALFLGPGTSITHNAVKIIADDTMTIVWTGIEGVRAYSTITPLLSAWISCTDKSQPGRTAKDV